MTKRNYFVYGFYFFILLLACFFFLMEESQAATYNFFFNNTEQGDNSTASPNLTVSDGMKLSNGKPGEPAPFVVTPGTPSSEVKFESGSSVPSRWKMFMGYTTPVGNRGYVRGEAFKEGVSYHYDQQFTLGLGYFLNDRFAIRGDVFRASRAAKYSNKILAYDGGETRPYQQQLDPKRDESTPTDFSLGVSYTAFRFRPNRGLNLGFAGIGGVMTLPTVKYTRESGWGSEAAVMSTANGLEHEKNLFAGVELSAMVLDSFGIEATYRRILPAGISQANLGMAVLF